MYTVYNLLQNWFVIKFTPFKICTLIDTNLQFPDSQAKKKNINHVTATIMEFLQSYTSPQDTALEKLKINDIS